MRYLSFLSLLSALFLHTSCKTSQPSAAISSPYSVGTVLPAAPATSMDTYNRAMKDVRFPATDQSHRVAVNQSIREKVIPRLQSLQGMVIDECADADGMTVARVTLPTLQLFNPMQRELTGQGVEILRKLSACLNTCEHTVVCIDVHCEKSTFAQRAQMTEIRAERIADALVAAGLDRQRIVATAGCSDALPVASNDTDEGKAKNRRAEIFVCADKRLYEMVQAGERRR